MASWKTDVADDDWLTLEKYEEERDVRAKVHVTPPSSRIRPDLTRCPSNSLAGHERQGSSWLI